MLLDNGLSLRTAAGWLAAAALLGASPAGAVEAAWSGFATLGYARVDSDHRHQRFIDRDGTLERDSLLAGQLDLALAPRWSATVQVKLAADEDHEAGLRARTAWAFLAWRPDDDWLVRAGRVRLPLYLQSESLDLGVARDLLRMPQEMYALSPTNEINGLSAVRTATWGETELTIDAFLGTDRTSTRMWRSAGLPPAVDAGASYARVRTKFSGLSFTGRRGGFTWRAGVGAGTTRPLQGAEFTQRYVRVDVAPGLWYWKIDAAMPGPALPTTPRLHSEAVTLGADWQLGAGWRISGEAAHIRQADADFPYDGHAGYLAVFKRVGAATPYVSVARQRSGRRVLEWYRRLTEERLPAAIPGADVINAAQQVAAESLLAVDQRSLALGASYTLSPQAKLHAEWLRTAVGRVSSHFDAAPGQPGSAGLRVHTTSLALSVAF